MTPASRWRAEWARAPVRVCWRDSRRAGMEENGPRAQAFPCLRTGRVISGARPFFCFAGIAAGARGRLSPGLQPTPNRACHSASRPSSFRPVASSAVHNPAFDRRQALEQHRRLLLEKRRHIDRLIAAIDNTIQHVKGDREMTTEEKFAAFKEKLIEDNERQFGEDMADVLLDRLFPGSPCGIGGHVCGG